MAASVYRTERVSLKTVRQVVEHGLGHLARGAHRGHGFLLGHPVFHAVGDGLRVELFGLFDLVCWQAGKELAQPVEKLVARHDCASST